MIRRLFTHCLLKPEDIKPSRDDMQVVGVLNPAAVMVDGEVVLMVRVAERPIECPAGCTALPRYEPGRGLVVDHVRDEELEVLDPRLVRLKINHCRRLTFISHIRVMKSRDGKRIDHFDLSRFSPVTEYETFGVEDPRVTMIDGRYYMTYVAVSPHGAATALAVTDDFKHFERLGIIFLPENKDVLLFPGKVGGRYVALHRPNPSMHFTPPEMWISYSDNLLEWGGHEHLLAAGTTWDAGRIGGGCPPVLTERGWLEIYHGNDKKPGDKTVGAYYAAAFLMDRDKPGRIVGHTCDPIMQPLSPFETHGFVPNVIFPTGLVEREDRYDVYYGAADACCGVTAFDKVQLLNAM